MAKFAKGTNVRDVTTFDRSIKVEFHCKEHPGPVYRSKEPSWSSWFPSNQEAIDIHNGAPDPCDHKFRDDVWVLAEDYEPRG